MKNKKVYLILIVLVICSIFLFRFIQRPANNVSAVSVPCTEVENNIFPAPDKTVYDMRLYLDVIERILYGESEIRSLNTSGKILDKLCLTAYPNVFKKSNETPAPKSAYYAGFNEGWLHIKSITVNGNPLDYVEDGATITIQLLSPIKLGENIDIHMEWQAKIPRVEYRFGCKDYIFMLGNFYPTLNVLSDDGWHNSYNSVFGDPFCFQAADYRVNVSVPQEYTMISTGDVVNRGAEDNGREIYTIEARGVRDFCLAAMYGYTEIKEIIKGKTIKCYLPVKGKEIATDILKKAGKVLNYYSCQFGSYPYNDFKLVFVPMQGFHGMEYSGLIFLKDEFLQKSYDHNHRDFVLAHEVAHQWWYLMVGNDQLREPWLDEGLANWSAYKYLQDIEGKNPPAHGQINKKINLGKELRDMYSRQEYYYTAYTGGETFWFALEEEIGEETVVRVLRRYLADYRKKIATTEDLIEVIKTETGEDLEDFFQNWFPDLEE